MKTFVVAFFAIVLSTAAFSQNKTLGVGTATPNPNAALHVESPTNNQGFIMPRLSTTQRTGIPATAGEDGMLLYDRDLKKFFFWDGAAWQPATGINFPFTGLATTPAVAFNIVNSGTGTAGIFQISNATNSVPALGAATNGTGSGLQIDVTNASNSVAALNINHAGTGNAIFANRPIQATQFIGDGSLLTNLPGFTLPYTATSGTAATTFNIGNTSTGIVAMFANSGSSSNSAVVVSNAGTGDGLFVTTSNVSNTFPALNITHSGSGSAIRANRLIETAVTANTGQAGAFAITNSSNASSALIADTNGNGSAGNFSITNAVSSAPVLFISHTGTGNAITTTRPIQASSFIGDGSALTNLPGLVLPYTQSPTNAGVLFSLQNNGTGQTANFSQIGNASALVVNQGNTGPGATGIEINQSGNGFGIDLNWTNGGSRNAIDIDYNGTGAGAFITNTSTTGHAADFTNTNVANNSITLDAETLGTGSAGLFTTNNAANTNPTLFSTTNGIGSAGNFSITNGASTAPVLLISHAGSGNAITTTRPIQASAFVGDGSGLTGVVVTDVEVDAGNAAVRIGKSTGESIQGVVIGNSAGASNAGIGNVFVGSSSGSANTSGTTNVFVGQNAGSNNDTGNNNVLIGGDAGLVSNGNTNVFVGWNAGANNTSGTSNVIIGAGAGDGVISAVPQSTGSNNVLIGTHADVGTDGLTNATAIGFEAVVNASNSIVLGNSNTSIGIGVMSPTAKFDVVNVSPSGNTVKFSVTNSANSTDALSIDHAGTGRASMFTISNASNSVAAVEAITSGTGSAADFSISNVSNASPALDVSTTGTGSAILASSAQNGTTIIANHTAGSGNGIDVNVSGTGTGKAGSFTISNTSNTAAAVEAYTTGTGPAILANQNQTNSGIAIDITNGTLKYSVYTTAGTSIVQRAGVYNLTGPGSYSLPVTGVVDGETCLVYNSNAGSITVESVTINNGEIRQFVRIASAWRVVL